MIYFKGHETDKGTIIAMCDEELLGRVLKEGKRELDLEKYSGFYNEELITEQEAKSRIKDDLYTANVVGKRSVQIFALLGSFRGCRKNKDGRCSRKSRSLPSRL